MASNDNDKELRTALSEGIRKNNHDKVVVVAKKLLKEDKDDDDVFQCLVTALLLLERFDDALAVLDGRPGLRFEHAYALYRMRENVRACEVLRDLDEPRAKHLRALLCVRLEKYDESEAIYREFLEDRKLSSDERAELITNLTSSLISAGKYAEAIEVVSTMNPKEITYNLFFNQACAEVELGEFDAARMLLEKAIELCNDQELGDEALVDELAPLQVQLGYVHQQLGDAEKAHHLYNAVLHALPSTRNSAVVAVASTNIISLRTHEEKIFDSIKRSARALKVVPEKLNQKQIVAIKRNHALLLMYEKQRSECRAAVSELQRIDPTDDFAAIVLASSLFREKKFIKCEEILKGCSSVEARLDLAHVQLAQGNVSSAVEVLTSLEPRIRYQPASVAVVCALLERLNRVDDAIKHLRQSIEFHQGKDEASVASLKKLLNATGDLQLRVEQFSGSKSSFERLLQLNSGDDLAVAAKLVLVCSRMSPEGVQQFTEKLPKLQHLTDAQVEALERDIGATGWSSRKTEEQEPAEEAGAKVKKTKKKKSRKPRYPKGFDPANPGPAPDPERWLPRYERSYYNKGRRRDIVLKGAQGAVSIERVQGHRTRAPREDPNRQHNLRQQASANANKPAPQKKNKKKKKKKDDW